MVSKCILFVFLFTANIFMQTTTYSKYEEQMITYANNGWFFASIYDSSEIAQKSLDSCWKFIEKYPNSFAKSNVLNFMLESTILLTNEKDKIYPLIDSVMKYDKMGSTRLRMGEILIERNLDIQKGRDYILEVFDELTTDIHKLRGYQQLARSEITLGKYNLAQKHYEDIINLYPGQLGNLYEFLAFSKLSEQPNLSREIQSKIEFLESKRNDEYVNQITSSANVNKDVSNLILEDLFDSSINLSSFKSKNIVLNSFNLYCNLGQNELLDLCELKKEFPDVIFLFVYSGISKDELTDIYFKKKELSFLKEEKVLFANEDFIKTLYSFSFPHTMIIDKKSKVKFEFIGSNKNFKSLLKSSLKKLEK